MDKRNNAPFIRLFVKEGVPATNPVSPVLQRDQYVHELSLAQIRLTKNTSSLEPLKLVDERMKEDLCGIVYSLISVPTSVFQQQWDYWFNLKKQTLEDDLVAWQVQQKNEFDAWQAEQEQEFLTWFESIKDILSGDVAANLAARIASLEQTVNPHIADLVKHNNYGTATGTNTLVVTLTPAPTTLTEGFTLRFKNTTSNTGATTLNVNGLGAKPLRKNGGIALSAGNLKAGGIYSVTYDGVKSGTLNLSKLIPGNIKNGVTIDGVTGNLIGSPTPSVGDAAVVASVGYTVQYTSDFKKIKEIICNSVAESELYLICMAQELEKVMNMSMVKYISVAYQKVL
ncbi:hypothetical protein ABD91_05760 [Lysinibacillus sphaericus]|uniref:hypothetical protein n=1 Tax=Lysinibacillus sphaericus TaxID=1421 RepID=UPI0018CC7F42|nr:hypothetical protein [Lysinibacillus sphaericus]MBG9690400.1 hypothetical protein [Lysinibacillus sphaericus]